ncbi:Interferon- developmental regulator 2 [Apophysomyces ossiformis]|uniref:Interferon- developmental regulator 2 n=1 Tax=Apophysomyces ossiformis TaxID=679940 RepID=A0A8H7EMM6_9FUNG|nr:Interferon- developmental regulator 2 [Apophysomyces ossiformis]
MPSHNPKRGQHKAQGEQEKRNLANQSWSDKINQAIDDLAINRTSVREEALDSLISGLLRHYAAEVIEPRNEELLILLKRSLSKGGSQRESCLAANAIALAFVNHGDMSLGEEEDLYQVILPTLKATLSNSTDITIKSNCIQTMALITFIAASDIDTQLVRNYLYDIIETEGEGLDTEGLSTQDIDQLLSAALRAYGLLYISSFSEGILQSDVIWEEIEKVMPLHEMLLESSDKDVRVAAGENIAVMFEIMRICVDLEDEDEEFDEEAEQYPEYDNMDGLLYTLKQLSVESGRRQTKSDRAEQKSVFRDVTKSVEEGIKPVEELKISGKVITFRGWSKILVLNAFRRSIGQGLQQHFKTNDLLRQIFHFSGRFSTQNTTDDDDDEEKHYLDDLSKVDKHYVYEERDKARSKQLRIARNGKDRA